MDTYLIGVLVALGLTTLPCCLLIVFYAYPKYVARGLMKYRQYVVGMTINYVGDEDFIYCYGERNKPQTDKTSILFVHGYTASKDMWIPLFQRLPSNTHLVAVDLPGHGGSTCPQESFTIEFIVEKLHKFIDLMFPDRKVHLVGASLGGAIVGVYAANHPERVEKVTLVCPAMSTPVESQFSQSIKEKSKELGSENLTYDHCDLLPQTVDGLKRMLELVCYNKDILNAPDQLWKGFLFMRLEKYEGYLEMFRAMAKDEYFALLETLSPSITMPSQIIWGRQDQIFHISGVEILHSKLPDCRHVNIFNDCGHAIYVDKPQELTNAVLNFHTEEI